MSVNSKHLLATALILLFIITSVCSVAAFGQQPINVTDQTVRLGNNQEEVLYFGFSKGDKIIFNFSEEKNKELREVEVYEYPSTTRFSAYKVSSVLDKEIVANKTGVYVFRIKNGALTGRTCNVNIQRIPADESTISFDTDVQWIVRYDTTWQTNTKDVIVGYDTLFESKKRKELVKIDTSFNSLFDKNVRVHSATAIGKSPYTYLTIDIPANSYQPNVSNPYHATEVVSWSYWIGVGQKAAEEYEKANSTLSNSVIAIADLLGGYGGLASLAMTGISPFLNPSVGDNVIYKFYTINMLGREVVIDHGNVISGSGSNQFLKQGSFYVELYNDNVRDGIDVSLKMIVMQVTKTWADVSFTEKRVVPITQHQQFRTPIVTNSTVPVVKN